MARLIVRNAARIVTMDGGRRELADASILIEDGVIRAVGTVEAGEGEVIDARGCVVTPGLVNTHHHLYQTLTRAVPAGQDALLFGWLKALYPIWARYEPEDMFVSAQLGLAELALSGCTMSSDHLYLFPNGSRLEDTIEAAGTVGIRFHPTRGAMSVGESAGGLPPDSVVEAEPAILADMVRVVDAFHDPLARGDGAGGAGALLAFLGLDGADGGRGGAGAGQGGDAAHPPRRERGGHRLFARARSAAGRGSMRRTWAGRGRTSGTPIASSSTRARSGSSPGPAPGWRTAPARTAVWGRGSRRCGRCATPG